MPELTVTLDRESLIRLRRLTGASRLAAAKGLTFTAEKARDDWRAGEAIRFHLRRKWLQTGTRIQAATPDNLNAIVGSKDRFFGRHVVGINEPKEGKLFIPIYARIADVRTHQQERRALARMDDTKRKPFIFRADGKTFLARRLGKERGKLALLGKFQDGAKVTPRFDAVGITEQAVRTHFPTIYERLLIKALEQGHL